MAEYLEIDAVARELNMPKEVLLDILRRTKRKVGVSGPCHGYELDLVRLAVADHMRVSRPLEKLMDDYDLSTENGMNALMADLPLIVELHGQELKNSYAELWGKFIEHSLKNRKNVWLPFGKLSVKERSARNTYSPKLKKTVPIPARTDINLDRAFKHINKLFKNKEN